MKQSYCYLFLLFFASISIVQAQCPVDISYGAASFCINRTPTTVTPTVSNGGGTGTFSAPAGLDINPSTGVINLPTSTPSASSYTITYTVTGGTCPGVAQVDVFITDPSVTITYSSTATEFCRTSSLSFVDRFPTIDPNFLSGVTCSVSPTGGLSIDPDNGFIISYSSAGTYTVTYEVNAGGCTISDDFTIIVVEPLGTPTISYDRASYCVTDANPILTVSPIPPNAFLTDESFSATPTGLALNTTTGAIDLATSTPGTYTVTLTRTNACSPSGVTATTNIEVIEVPADPVLSYDAALYCTNQTPNLVTPQTATPAGGTFSVMPTTGLSINATTGEIDVATSTAGNYTITYEVGTGTCLKSTTFAVEIADAPVITAFNYTGSPFCRNDPSPIKNPNIAPALGVNETASFSVSRIGLSLDLATGEIDVSTSTSGNYIITYLVTNTVTGCQTTRNTTIDINDIGAVDIEYAKATYCLNEANPSPSVKSPALPLGTFSTSSPNLVVDPSTGVIDIAASLVGTYTITYEVVDGACTDTDDFTVTIATPPSITTFEYAGTPFCRNDASPIKNPTTTPALGANETAVFTTTSTEINLNGTTGAIDVSNSTAGTYTITYIVTNTVTGCETTATTDVTINEVGTADIAYAKNTYCQDESNPSPSTVLPATPAGVFSAAPAGLSIDNSTGLIDLSTSTLGTYTITYTITESGCTSSDDFTVTVAAPPTITTFEYAGTPFCRNDPSPVKNPTIAPALGANETAAFSATPTGLDINTTTGAVDVSLSDAGTYTITYTVTNTVTGCQRAQDTNITIDDIATADIAYANATYCLNESNPSPSTILPTTPTGTFSAAPAGLSIDTNSGLIDLSASTAGTYTITYTITEAGCTSSDDFTVTIVAPPTITTFEYAGTPFCRNDASPVKTPSITPTLGANETATFSATPTGLNFNTTNGEIDVSASDAGTYTITYTVTNSVTGCQSVATTTVDINDVAVPVYAYSQGSYCIEASTITPATLTPAGGTITISATPASANLSINTTTGEIDLSASDVGEYVLTYTVNATGCTRATTTNIRIEAPPTITSFAYAGPYCNDTGGNVNPSSTAPDPSSLGANEVASFSATPSGLSLNATTGVIDVANSAPNTYTVTYRLTNTATNCSTEQTAVVVIEGGEVAVTYQTNLFCIYDTQQLPTQVTPSGGTFSATGGLPIDATTGEIDVPNSVVGDYVVTYTVSVGGVCGTIMREIDISIVDPPAITAINASRTTIVQGESVTLSVDANGGTSFVWEPAEGLSDATIENPEATPLENTTYTVTVANEAGCSTTGQIDIEVIPSEVFVPNSFFPNSSNVNNNTFKVLGNGIAELSIKIYDRLGALIYETSDLNQATRVGWDGTYNGEKQPAGTYVWYISGKFLTGAEISIDGKNTGSVVLLK